ncbi:MAG: hypothetical protein L0G59_09955, partial [Kocuria sp.]|nr:hypothetical protein [Kocuria sp.]
ALAGHQSGEELGAEGWATRIKGGPSGYRAGLIGITAMTPMMPTTIATGKSPWEPATGAGSTG